MNMGDNKVSENGTHPEDGTCELHREGSGGTDGIRGDGTGVGDISEMPVDSWDSGHTTGGDDGWETGRDLDTDGR
jgi:hypothetical protein